MLKKFFALDFDRNLKNRFSLPLIVLFNILNTSCGTPATNQETVNRKNNEFTLSKQEDLLLAESVYKGTVHLNSSAQDFDCVLEIQRSSEFTRIPQNQNSRETIEVPKLSGSMGFPALENIQVSDLSSYSSLTAPMGGFLRVIFNFGNYNSYTRKLILPYTVPGYTQNSFGQLDGTLIDGNYQGTWFSKPFGVVGRFNFVQVNSHTENTQSSI